MSRTVLLTGGTGFVGAVRARRLGAEGHAAHLWVRPGRDRGRLRGLDGRVTLHEVSLSDAPGLVTLVAQLKPTWIFHLAVYGAYSTQKNEDTIYATNLQGTLNLLRACAAVGFEAFVNTGSSSEYGLKDHPPAEDEAIAPNSHYAIAKAAATHVCQLMAQQTGLWIPTLRLYSVYGPFEEPTRLMPTLLIRAMAGIYPPLVSPETARDFVWVDDVASAYLMAAQNPQAEKGAVYNVGSGQQVTLGQVVETVRRLFELKVEPVWGEMQNRHWDTTVWVSAPDKIRRCLGWTAETGLEKGLGLFAEWLTNNPAERALYEEKIRQGLTPV